MRDLSKSYQPPIERPRPTAAEIVDLKDSVLFDESLGNDDRYMDFLRFFETEIAEKGVPTVLREYILKGDERANDIFCRIFTDLVHPMFHVPDEGHVENVIRALFSLEELSQMGLPDFPIAKKDFINTAHMTVDSVERDMETDSHQVPEHVVEGVEKRVGEGGEMVTGNMRRFVFYGGLDEAWDYISDLTSH